MSLLPPIRPEILTVSKEYFERLMASNTWRALEALVSWSDEVEYRTSRGARPCLVIRFKHSDAFFRWKDWIGESYMTLSYVRLADDSVVVTVPVEAFFKSVSDPKKWHVNNRGK